jgi:hypothetical protein
VTRRRAVVCANPCDCERLGRAGDRQSVVVRGARLVVDVRAPSWARGSSSASETAANHQSMCACRFAGEGSSPAGPQDRRCSTPAIVCESSRPGIGCADRSHQSSGTSTGSCAAGRVSSATATRPSRSTTSSDTRNGAYSCGSQPAVSSRGTTAERHSTPGLAALDWSASTELSPRPGLTGRGVREQNAGGEERR